VTARKKKAKRSVNWPFRLFVILMLLLAVGWTLYNYGVKPWRERQQMGLEARKAEIHQRWELKSQKLAEDYEPAIEDLKTKLMVLQRENADLHQKLKSGEAPAPGYLPETEQ